MKVLDLFCGHGGWSKGFAKLGYECTGVDIRKMDYPYRFIKADLYDWEPDQYYDIVLASPPCTEFSAVNQRWNGKANESKGLGLVYRTYHLIEKMKPKWYCIENVRNLAKFIGPPKDIVRYGKSVHSKHAYLWGSFPSLDMLIDGRRNTTRATYKKAPHLLGEIPPFLSEGLAMRISEQNNT